MKLQKGILSLLLCAALLLSMAACGGGSPEPTKDTTPPTTQPAATEPAAESKYQQARAAVDSASDVVLRISADQTTTVGGESFTEHTEQTLSYSGLGADTLQVYSKESVDYSDGYTASFEEVYADGTLYVALDEAYFFCGAVTAEECTQRYLPAVLLDDSLYGSITEEASASMTVVTFSEPAAAESWAVPEDAQLLEASGTASLSAAGELQKTTYTVSYTYGPAEILLEVSMYINLEQVDVPIPENAEDYISLQSVDAPRLLEQASGYLYQAEAVSTSALESAFSQAVGVLCNQSTATDYYTAGGDVLAKVDTGIYFMDYTTYQDQTLDQVERYIDGVYTVAVDGEEPETQTGVTDSIIDAYCQQLTASHLLLLDPYFWQDAVITELDSTWLVELTLNGDSGDVLHDSVCTALFGDTDFLDGYASAYVTNASTGYLALDKYTGLPTAAGFYYEGQHTIDGDDYLLSLQSDQSIEVPGLSAYKAITEENPLEQEPETKATPLFYHVTGSNGQEMWLLGTIHVGDERTAYLPQEIYDAFSASDALALEYNSEAFEEQVDADETLQDAISDAYYYSDGTCVQDHIDGELYETAVRYMKASGSYNMNTDYLKPSIWSNCIENFYLRQGYCLNGDQGVEERLEKLAQEQEKEILEVESGLSQLQMMTGYSDELQEFLLAGTIDTHAVEYWSQTAELYELWCQGDEDALREALKEDTSDMTEEELALYQEYRTAMETNRNAGMLQTAMDYLESGDVVFYAVGLAHLLAEDGLVTTLRDAGYTVELVSYS